MRCPRGYGSSLRVCVDAGWCRGKHPAPPQPHPRRSARARGGYSGWEGRAGICNLRQARSRGRPLESDPVPRARRRQAADPAPRGATAHRKVAGTTDNRAITTLLYGWSGLTCGLAGNHLCAYIKNTQRTLRRDRPKGSEAPKGHAHSNNKVCYVTTTQHRSRQDRGQARWKEGTRRQRAPKKCACPAAHRVLAARERSMTARREDGAR